MDNQKRHKRHECNREKWQFYFLPAAGWFDGKLHKSLDINGDFFGSYWSSTSSSFLGCAEGLGFGVDFNNKNTIRHDIYSSKCFIGSTIRPVTQ